MFNYQLKQEIVYTFLILVCFKLIDWYLVWTGGVPEHYGVSHEHVRNCFGGSVLGDCRPSSGTHHRRLLDR